MEDYTVPKPGWSATIGWTFPFLKYHEVSAFFQSGHRVVSGENPLVRALDIVPFQWGAEYAYSPIRFFLFGVDTGGGFFYSSISHYETAVKLLSDELTTTTGISPFFAASLHAGIQLFDGSVHFKVLAGIECIAEADGLIPVPTISFQARVYPVRTFRYIRKASKVVEKVVEKERIVEVPVFRALPPFPFDEYNIAVIYFDTKEDSIRESVIGVLDSVGAYLEAVPELTIIIEGNSAPFDTEDGQYIMGIRRAKVVREYLLEHFNIASRRIRVTSVGSSRSGVIIEGAENEAYTEFRCARIILDEDSLAKAKRRLSQERRSVNKPNEQNTKKSSTSNAKSVADSHKNKGE